MKLVERPVTYLTAPRGVRVSEQYFLNASLSHFWVVRRFQVMRRIADAYIRAASRIAEIGCGHGVVQRQIELAYNREAEGFDLNEFALKHNVSERSGVFCYDVHERLPQLQGVYDLLLLLDVLEHIENEDEFIDSLLFLLAPAGRFIINVPAGQYLFSAYDRVQGHCRRYALQGLREVMHRNGLRVLEATYWGLPMVPFALMRRLFHNGDNEEEVMRKGFLPPGELANRILGWICCCERIPQRLLGTSVMMVVQRK